MKNETNIVSNDKKNIYVKKFFDTVFIKPLSVVVSIIKIYYILLFIQLVFLLINLILIIIKK
jgi:hypothetical protein